MYLIHRYFEFAAKGDLRRYGGKLAERLTGVRAFSQQAVRKAAVESSRLGIVVEQAVEPSHLFVTGAASSSVPVVLPSR